MPFFIVFVVWIALAIGCMIFFYGPFDVRAKRRAWPIVTVAAAIAFGLIAWWQSGSASPPWLLIPILGVIVWLNLKMGRFCDACGAFQQRMSRMPWQSIRPSPRCIKCGAEIPTGKR
jgi:hypothetical protein